MCILLNHCQPCQSEVESNRLTTGFVIRQQTYVTRLHKQILEVYVVILALRTVRGEGEGEVEVEVERMTGRERE